MADSANLETCVGATIDEIDDRMVVGGYGIYADRPAAGVPDRLYFASDRGTLYYDNGSAWTVVGPADDSITSAKIAADAVTSSEIATDAVGTAEIAANAVGSSEIAADAVGSSEIAAQAVGTSELADGGVSPAKLAEVPHAAVYNGGSSQSIPNAVVGGTAVLFQDEDFDTQGMHDSTNKDRLTATRDGVYAVTASIPFLPNGVGNRSLSIRKNNGSSAAIVTAKPDAAYNCCLVVSTLVRMDAGDYVRAMAAQDSGGALALQANYSNRFTAVWLGP